MNQSNHEYCWHGQKNKFTGNNFLLLLLRAMYRVNKWEFKFWYYGPPCTNCNKMNTQMRTYFVPLTRYPRKYHDLSMRQHLEISLIKAVYLLAKTAKYVIHWPTERLTLVDAANGIKWVCLRLLSLLLLAITRLRRKLDQISLPKQSESAIRHNTDPASNAASKWLILVKLTVSLSFTYPGSIPAWNSTGKTPYTKQAKNQRIVNVMNPTKMYFAVADSVSACLPRVSSSKIISRVPAGSIWRRNKGEAGTPGVQTSWPFAEKQRFSLRVFYSRYNQTNTALFVSRCLRQLINYAVQFARRGH